MAISSTCSSVNGDHVVATCSPCSAGVIFVMDAIIELASTLRRAADLLDVIAREAVLRKPEGPELPPLYSYQEAADYLRISDRVVERLASEGEIQKVLIGRRVLFAREDLDDYIARRRLDQ